MNALHRNVLQNAQSNSRDNVLFFLSGEAIITASVVFSE